MEQVPNPYKVYENDSGLPRFEGGQTRYTEGEKALSVMDKFLLLFPDTVMRMTKFPEGESMRVEVNNISLDQLRQMIDTSPKVAMTGFRAGPHEEGLIRWMISQIDSYTDTVKESLYLEMTVIDTVENRSLIENSILTK